MQEYIDKFNATHPAPKNTRGSGGMASLARESGVNQRKLYDYMHGELPRMSVRHADQILLAIGLQHMLGDEIPIEKSPNWSWRNYRLWIEGLITARN